MEREPTPAEKVLADFMAAVCTDIVFGTLIFGGAIGLGQLHPKLGITYFALGFCVLLFQSSIARRPWLKALADYFARAFAGMTVSRR